MNLAEVSDEELEAALKRKRASGLASVSDADLEAALARKRPKPPQSMLGRMAGAFTGNAAETLPDVYGSQFADQARGLREAGGRSDLKESAALSASAMFGDDPDVANTLQRQFPDAKIEADTNGNQIAVMPDGQRYYINQPGIDRNDVGRFAGKMLSYIPAAKVAGGLGSLGARVLAGAGGAGVTDIGMQLGALRSQIDPSQVLMSTVAGGVGEAALPLIKRGAYNLRQLFTSKPDLIKAGQAIAKRSGLQGISDDAAEALARRSDEIAAGASPEAILAEQEFGYRLSRGQMTGDESILRKEELLRSTQPNGPLGQLEKQNYAQTQANLDQFRQQAARGAAPEAFEQDAAQRVQEALREAQKAGRGQMRDAYAAVPVQNARAAAEDVAALAGRADKAIRGAGFVLTPEVTPSAVSAQRLIAQSAEEAGEMGMDKMIALRKSLSRIRNNAASREDQAATGIILKDFDQWFDDSLTRNLMAGGEDAVASFRNAQDIARRYFSKFESGKDESGKAIIRMLQAETPESVANVLLNANGVNKPGASAIARRYIAAVGKDSDGATALREIIARRMFQNAAGVDKGHQTLVSEIRNALNGRGRSLLGETFTKTELAGMDRFAQTLDRFFVPKGNLGRSSGTAERLAAWLSPYGNLPIIRAIKPVLEASRQRQAVAPLLGKRPNAAVAAFPAGYRDDEDR